MTKRTTLVLLGTLAVSLLITDRCPAAPNIGDLTGLPTTGPLGPTGEKAIDRYVAECIDELVKAKIPRKVKEAISNLKVGYQANPSVVFHIEYARASAKHAPSALSLEDDPLRRLKEINLSIEAARMDQYTILPILEAMAAHENPGVRYWAAKGFRNTGKRFLDQGGRYTRAMVSTLERLGLTDPAGPVVTEAIITLGHHSGEKGSGGKTISAALAKVWLARCQEVLAGKAGMAGMIRRSFRVIPRVAQLHLAPAQRSAGARKLALQMLVDAMEAGSLAFEAGTEDEDNPRTKALRRLLIGVETASAAQLGVNQTPVSGVLAGKEPLAKQRVKARLEVNGFWTPKFQAEGVTTRVKAPATKPAATSPAG